MTRGAEALPAWQQPPPDGSAPVARGGDRERPAKGTFSEPTGQPIGQPGAASIETVPPASPLPAQALPPRVPDGTGNPTGLLDGTGGPAGDVRTQLTLPPIQALETAIIPKVVEPPEEPPSLVELAMRNGLKPAGTRPGFGAYVAQLWRFRQFITTYANGRIVAAFGESRLGRLWQVLTPLANAAVYFLIFGVIIGTSRGIPNFIGYLCVGVFVFNYTSLVLSTAVQSISGQLDLVRALQFPRASLPIALSLVQVQNLIGSMIALAGIMIVTGEPVTTKWVWVVPALTLQSFFNLGLALAIARLGAKIADLKHLIPYVTRTWMYASGVLYNVSVFAEHLPAWASTIVRANPLLVYIELARYGLMKRSPLASTIPELWVMAGAWALVTLLFGFVYFWRGEAEYGRG